MADTLNTLVTAIGADPGLKSHISAAQIRLGLTAAGLLDEVLLKVIASSKVNADGILTAADMVKISAGTYANPADYVKFLEAHGNDNGTVTSGFHYVQNDGGSLMFQGREFINTVADAIYHFGFKITDGRYVNEDGNSNETTADVAGWLNYFLNGENVVFGGGGNDDLGSGVYSEYFAAARNETFMAGAGNDQIWADVGNDKVYGGDGNDRSGGGKGHDRLYGEMGNDTLWGEDGQDRLDGGAGADVIGGGTGNDTVEGGTGNDGISGEAGNDLVHGGDGNDTINGDLGADRLEGGAGDDQINGGKSFDVLLGDAGNDKVYAGDGSDYIRGGSGSDDISLWETIQSRDTICFRSGDSGKAAATVDHVEGFKSGIDKIDLRSFAGMSFEKLDYQGGGSASCYYDGHYLRIDSSGDGATDMLVEFRWQDSLNASDFLFA